MNQLRINSRNQINFFRSYMGTSMTFIHLKNHNGSLFLNIDFSFTKLPRLNKPTEY